MNASASRNPLRPLPRREFLKTSAGLALGATLAASPSLTAASRRRVLGANDRLRLGIIGCGDRGRNAHMEGVYKHVEAANFEIVALSDPWKTGRAEANAKVVKWFGRPAQEYDSHVELLARGDVDAVMIASPDHHHTTQLEAAARAGKHIYIEKPMAMDMAALNRAYDAVKQAGVVVQVGTQLRSLPGIVGSRALVEAGTFGQWSRIEECRNSDKPYWYRYLKDVKASEVNWKEFLGKAPVRPFRSDYFSGWYGYRDYTAGPIANLGCHFIDMMHYITGAKYPASCVCNGGIFTWKDEHEFTTTDCVQATWIYPEGFLVSSANNLGNGFGSTRKFYSEKGVLKVDNWNAPTYSAEGGPRRDGSIRGQQTVPLVERPDHYLDWLQCIRSGGTPHASIDAGHQHAVAVIMASMALETGRKTVYDPKLRRVATV